MKKTSYETSKKLADAGFKAETDFYWAKWNQGEPELLHEKEQTPALIEKVGAWDLETILEALPKFIVYNNRRYCLTFWLAGEEIYYEIIGEIDLPENYFHYIFPTGKKENESLADAAARLWLKLKEMGLV